MNDLLKMLSDFVWDAEINSFTLAEWIKAQPRNWAYINHLFKVEGFHPVTFGWDDGKGRRVVIETYPYVQTADLSSYGSGHPLWSSEELEERKSYRLRNNRQVWRDPDEMAKVVAAVSATILEEGD